MLQVLDMDVVREAAELDSNVILELTDILEAAERSPSTRSSAEVSWFYWVPAPGVRYYSYHQKPAPVERPRHLTRSPC